MKDQSYIKIDALTCRKRFHCRKRTDLPKQKTVVLKCPECNALLFKATDAHPLQYLRTENLLQSPQESDFQSNECQFFDKPIED